jgi:hypothetical protein
VRARKPSASASGRSSGRLGLAVLVATVAAFLLVPVAQAAANGVLKVNIEGPGSGEVAKYPGAFGGEFECSYSSPGPATGECEPEMKTNGEGNDEEDILSIPASGSEVGKLTINRGKDLLLFGPEYDCENKEGGQPEIQEFLGGWLCGIEGEAEEKGGEVTVCFVKEGEGEAGCETGNALTVTKEGTGGGTVVSNPSGVSCGGTCSASFKENTKVTLTASPDSESLFVSWKGCEVGGANGRECKVTMDKAKTVSAKFIKAYDVKVSRKGTGLGKVGSSPGGVLCLSNCSSTSAQFKEATNVTLTATPSKHFTFTGWSGDCTGTGTCVLSALSADKSVEAQFAEVAKFDLTVTKSGGGQGTVKAKQAGINCGATCTTMAAKYYEGEVIELLAPVPGKGSTFGGWSGSGCSGTGTCLVTMSSAKTVNAEFK